MTTAVTKVKSVEIMRPDDAIVVRGKNGNIRRIKTNVSVSVEEGTLVKLFGGQEGGTFVLTYAGFLKLAQACNVAVLHPPTIIVNGQEQPNPYQDPVTERVHSRSVAVGFTAYGLKAWVERTVMFDPNTSNKVDLISKGNRKENGTYFSMQPANFDDKGRLLRPVGLKRALRKDVKAEKEFKEASDAEVNEEVDARWERWAGYQIDAGMAIWVDTSCPDVYSWQREMLNRSDKSLRTCQTFSDRNSLSAHPALPRQRKFTQAKATLECVMWYCEGGNMGYDQSLMMIDPAKLLAAEGTQTTIDVAPVEDISKENPNKLAGEEGDLAPDDAPPAETKEEDDDIPFGDKPNAQPAAENGEKAAERQALFDQVMVEEKRIGVKGPIRRARVASGIGTDEGGLALADKEQLVAYLSLLKEAK